MPNLRVRLSPAAYHHHQLDPPRTAGRQNARQHTMEAVQKSLDHVAKRAPALHSASSSSKAAATNPTVHDSIDRLISQIEQAQAVLASEPSASSGILAAELKHSVESAQKAILDRQKEFYAAITKTSKALDKKFPVPIEGVADPALFSSTEAQSALERVILKHLQRNGDWSTSQLFAHEAGLPISKQTEDLFAQLHHITTSMSAGDLRPAIAWAESQRSFLAARKSPLEFALHRSQFIRIATGVILPGTHTAILGGLDDPDGENVEMITASTDKLPHQPRAAPSVYPEASADTNTMRALEYGRKTFQPFLASHLPEIQRLLTLLPFIPSFIPAPSYGVDGLDAVPVEHLLPSVPAIYRPLLDANLIHAPFLEPLFRSEFCARNRIAKEAPLSIGVEIGAGGALNRIIKVKAVMKERGNEWSQADELPVSPYLRSVLQNPQTDQSSPSAQIEIPLPNRLRFHSIFACPVSKEQGTEQNPPMMLACGHVLCLETLQRLAKGNG